MRKLFQLVVVMLLLAVLPALGQATAQRLILKDGSYQLIKKYEIKGDLIRYLSAERGEWEELPRDMVDWAATEKWAHEHAPGAAPPPADSPAASAAAEIDKEEALERAAEAARTPEVTPGLRLPDGDGVWALDTFHGAPELVQVNQSTGGISERTGHNVLKATLGSLGGSKQQIQIEGARSKVRLHVNDPALYVSLDSEGDTAEAPSGAVAVDTHGLGSAKDKGAHSSPTSRYAIVRLQVRKDTRVVGSVNISMLGNVSQSEDVVATNVEFLPGKHWMRLTPKQPLDIGDYALVELLSNKDINLDVWDFRIDPTAPENLNSIMPLHRER